ncbi:MULTISPECIES: SCO family protein [Acetobacter]|nr:MULTISPECIES: SCO family protein [Acetobacter]MCG4262296.1 SCO family protein [Acetobacter senegalensis]
MEIEKKCLAVVRRTVCYDGAMTRKKPIKIALTKQVPLSRRQEWKKIFPLLCIIMFLFSGAAGLRLFLTSQQHTQIGGPYTLVNGHGQTVSQADFEGHYTLLYFGYTHCVDICPLTLATVSAALDELGKRGQNIIPVFISVDPERDTPAVLQEYVERFSPHIVGLTGSESQLQPVMKAFHVSARRRAPNGSGYLVDHSSLLYLMDGQNHLVGMIPVDASAHQIASELRRLLPSS